MPPGAPQFTYEKDLVAAMRPTIARLLGSHQRKYGKSRYDVDVLQEFAVGMKIPDVVLIGKPCSAQDIFAPQRVSLMESSVLFELYREGPQTQESISQVLYSRESIVHNVLRRLQETGAVEKIDSGEFRATEAASPGDVVIVAVEAKLRNWKEAIRQAESYWSFSNYSYIALPSLLIRKKNTISDACRSIGIGLIAVSPRSTRVVVKPAYNFELEPEWLWLLSRVTSSAPKA